MNQLRLWGPTPEGSISLTANKCVATHQSQKTPPNEELEEIHDTIIACEYLEKTELIVPVGQPISIGTLSNAIHHVTNYRGVSKLAINS